MNFRTQNRSILRIGKGNNLIFSQHVLSSSKGQIRTPAAHISGITRALNVAKSHNGKFKNFSTSSDAKLSSIVEEKTHDKNDIGQYAGRLVPMFIATNAASCYVATNITEYLIHIKSPSIFLAMVGLPVMWTMFACNSMLQANMLDNSYNTQSEKVINAFLLHVSMGCVIAPPLMFDNLASLGGILGAGIIVNSVLSVGAISLAENCSRANYIARTQGSKTVASGCLGVTMVLCIISIGCIVTKRF